MAWNEEDDVNKKPQESIVDQAQGKQSTETKLVDALKEVLGAQVVERRRQRRWKIFFRFVYLFVFIGVVVSIWVTSDMEDVNAGDSVAVLRMQGTIGAQSEVDANEYVPLLDEIYANSSTKAVLIEMNSPGGSPVHSGILYDAIMHYRTLYPAIPVVVAVEDLAASGGYYIASAADEIVVDKASLVGSIGVVSGGFEASELIEKLGVKRRLFTAGENKAFMDPFSPMSDAAVQSWQSVLDETHKQFINAVKEGRGDRLADEPNLFTGMVFTGTQAVELGLADRFGYAQQLLNTQFSDLTPTYYTPYKEPWEKVAKQLGVEFSTGVTSWLYGLR
ncbi:Putative signal peptide peptidase SppA [Marinomonas gallaica]|uniref:Signal peptide peptidase SppA n=1 Tax=Marinomonas gallaica TaxID=1806667 RepID=A0A1C3JUE3_9GAMM|nr:S49 family peptidase [Marinomonas gallaica]SBT18757.1 Putative signal peptide peptidase SppA [Marinomonas gallaica]SBT21712.1 Putative signal peptide peptidase SppA [Marinomonas gallaica]